ncbi:MAG: helix-turn-helix domain-containing protein [Treponema sp.]|nr:helix-turn-helix domain-containing protein [Treponema sp.]
MGENFRENLRKEIDYQGILVKELSAKTGIPVATLDCYLGTRATVPSVEAAYKIARALQVSVEYLITGEDLNNKKTYTKTGKEISELVKLIENLNPAQCRAILNLVNNFKIKPQVKK